LAATGVFADRVDLTMKVEHLIFGRHVGHGVFDLVEALAEDINDIADHRNDLIELVAVGSFSYEGVE
jgi:hypothetical protein